MPEAKKYRIVIASVLKPVDDTRGYEKIGNTLAGTGLYEIHMIGSGDRTGKPAPHVQFHSLGKFERLSWKRWLASFSVFSKVRKVKPDVLVISTHELLVVGIWAKLLLGCQVVYDVQENYFMNIRFTDAFPTVLRWPLAIWVRLKEIALSPFFDLFILAEKIYEGQLSFAPKRKSVIIENKAAIPVDFKRNPAPGIDLLFSGTLSESTGVFDAIRIASTLHSEDNSVRLHVIGYCADNTTRERLRNEVKGKPFVILTGVDEIQPHAEIFRSISMSNFGIVCYPPSPHTSGSFPTKAYEYLACGLPVLTTPTWSHLFDPYKAAVVVEDSLSPAEILKKMKTGNFYSTLLLGVRWEDESDKLVSAILQLTKAHTKHNQRSV